MEALHWPVIVNLFSAVNVSSVFKVMKLLHALLLLGLAPLIVDAKPQPQAPKGEPIAIISQKNEMNPDGSYEWSYESANSIKAEEKGTVRKAEGPGEEDSVVAEGSFSYTAPDGTPINLKYTADENGFVPQGAHLPTPPPIPADIQKGLDYIAANPSKESEDQR